MTCQPATYVPPARRVQGRISQGLSDLLGPTGRRQPKAGGSLLAEISRIDHVGKAPSLHQPLERCQVPSSEEGNETGTWQRPAADGVLQTLFAPTFSLTKS